VNRTWDCVEVLYAPRRALESALSNLILGVLGPPWLAPPARLRWMQGCTTNYGFIWGIIQPFVSSNGSKGITSAKWRWTVGGMCPPNGAAGIQLRGLNWVPMGMRLRLQSATIAVLMMVLGLGLPAKAQRTKRLVLTDGSYQSATQWEIQGDRVHYFSSERHEWEDIPKAMIDWKATEEFNSGKSSLKSSQEPALSQELKQESAEEAAERAKEDAQSPTIAPGLKLPSQGGVFLLDQFQGKPSMAEVVQNGSELNKHLGRNILRAAINPLPTGAKQTIELKGAHAKVQAHTTAPEIYVDIDQDTQQQPLRMDDRFRLVRVQTKKGNRVVGNLKVNLIGKSSEETSSVKLRAEKFSGDWVKLVPLENLAPGEYAVLEMLGPKSMNTYVWDFGVDPTAPANPTAWRAEPLKPNSTGSEESPVLLPKKN
jgi:hypothetical protein